jgi:uncharacterized membrane protein YkgB
MNSLLHLLTKSGLLTEDLDYRVVRGSMVIIFLLFGYQKWFAYEAQTLIPYISNGPLIAWMYSVFGIRGPVGFWGCRNEYPPTRACWQRASTADGIGNSARWPVWTARGHRPGRRVPRLG